MYHEVSHFEIICRPLFFSLSSSKVFLTTFLSNTLRLKGKYIFYLQSMKIYVTVPLCQGGFNFQNDISEK